MYKVYILFCNDLSFYVGYTNNLKARVADHNNKQGSKYLLSKLPAKLVYYEEHQTRIEALKREKQLKGWSRNKKINLIKIGNLNRKE